jgi:uncharacterized RDD family membrane protein YckC
MTATRSTGRMIAVSRNVRTPGPQVKDARQAPIEGRMNAIAHASTLPASGPGLDNRRVLAALIDLVVLGAGAALIGFVAGALNGGEVEFTPALDVIVLGWALYYYFACESGGGQTIGKRLMKLRVVRADGGHAGMREIFVRTILRVIDGIALYLVGLIVMLVTGERRQRLGDLAGGTVVVDAAAARVPAAPAPIPMSAPVTLPELTSERVENLPVAELRPFEPSKLPAAEVEAEPVVEVESHSEPVVEIGPEPVVEAEPEPVVDVEPAPAVEVEPEPAVEAKPVPLQPPPAKEAEAHAGEAVVVRPMETVSAIDLVMGEDDEEADR